jgi:hypothetical protein
MKWRYAMKNHIILVILIGFSVWGIYAGDAYDPLYPHKEAMKPWKPSKRELEMRKKQYEDAQRKSKAQNLRLQETQNALEVLRSAQENYDNKSYFDTAGKLLCDNAYAYNMWEKRTNQREKAFLNYKNARYDSQPKFPRIERFRNWVRSWWSR